MAAPVQPMAATSCHSPWSKGSGPSRMRRTLVIGQRWRRNLRACSRKALSSSLKSKFIGGCLPFPPAVRARLRRGSRSAVDAALDLAQRATALGQLLQQARRLPARTVALVPDRHLIVHLPGPPDLVGPIHQAAAVTRETEAVEPHHIDVAGA